MQTTETNKNKNMRSAFKMKGYSYPGKSPVTKKAGPETKQFDIDKMPRITSEDEETAYEDAVNDYNTDNPTKKQLAEALKKVKAERAHEAREDAEGK
jgi:hypothetical protein